MAFHLRRQLTTSGALSQVLTTYAHDAVAYPGRKHAKAWKRSIVSILGDWWKEQSSKTVH